MASNRDGRSNRESSRPRAPRHGSRRKHDSHDDNSIDSGYGGSSATASSPNLAQGRLGRGKRTAVDTNEVHSHDSDSDIDSDSDYDPKAKYYLKVDDDAYRDISFQGAGDAETDDQYQSSRARSKRRERKDDPPMKASRSRDRDRDRDRHRHPSSRARTDSRASGDGDGRPSRRRDSRHPHAPSRRASDTSRPRRDSLHRALSPIPSETSEDWETSPERPPPSRPRSRSRAPVGWRSRAATTGDNTAEQTDDSDYERAVQRRPSPPSPAETRRRADSMPSNNSAAQQRDDKSNSGRSARRGRSASSQYEGAADMDDAWYKTFKERITRGVDLKQVKKVGLEAAAVAAVKVAVGTQVPWKQRIPKTIAVGLAAAVTDFLVSKTSFQPKGMVGTMYARQFVEIALANLIINPVSSKVTTAAEAKLKGGGKDNGSGGKSSGGAGARVGAGRGRR